MWWLLIILGILFVVGWLVIFLLKLSKGWMIVGWVLLGLGLVLIVGGIVWFFLRKRSSVRDDPNYCFTLQEALEENARGIPLYGYSKEIQEDVLKYLQGQTSCPCLPSQGELMKLSGKMLDKEDYQKRKRSGVFCRNVPPASLGVSSAVSGRTS